MAKLTNRSCTATIRLTPENLSAATVVARLTGRTVSGLAEYALELYIRKNYPKAFESGVRLELLLDEAPSS